MERSALELFDPLERGPAQPRYRQWPWAGLYIVREIAWAHGGEVDVRSGKAETVFVVRLPRRKEDSFVSPGAK